MYIYMLPFHISVIINCASIQKISFSRSHLILDKSWTTPGMVPSQSEDTYLNNHSTIGQNSKSSISLNCQIVKRVNMQGSHWKAIGIYHLKCSDGQLNILYILARRKGYLPNNSVLGHKAGLNRHTWMCLLRKYWNSRLKTKNLNFQHVTSYPLTLTRLDNNNYNTWKQRQNVCSASSFSARDTRYNLSSLLNNHWAHIESDSELLAMYAGNTQGIYLTVTTHSR